jgi:hypothetical protein
MRVAWRCFASTRSFCAIGKNDCFREIQRSA